VIRPDFILVERGLRSVFLELNPLRACCGYHQSGSATARLA
jgi:hypothetical protein